MRNLFILSSPLQYLLARTIADQLFAGDENLALHEFDHGDFSAAFAQIDNLLGGRGFSEIAPFRIGGVLPAGSFDRLFMSNRFNPTEVDAALRLRRRTRSLCAFEDGISIYLGHHFQDRQRGEANIRARVKCIAKIWLFDAGLAGHRRPDFLPFSYFDEVYSVYPDVPGVRRSAKHVLIDRQFRDSCVSGAASSPGGERSCIILSQSLATDGLIDEDDLVDFMADRIRELQPRYDRIYFKSHPRDSAALKAAAASFALLDLPDEMRLTPVELFLGRNPGMDIYGFWSSTLVYGPLVGSRSYSFGELLASSFPANTVLQASWKANGEIMARFDVGTYTARCGA